MRDFFLKVREDAEFEKLSHEERGVFRHCLSYLWILSWSGFWGLQCYLLGHKWVDDMWMGDTIGSHCERCGDTKPFDCLE